VAEICSRGLRMKVIVYDPYITQEQAAACGAQLVSDLPGLLRESDFVTIHSPLNASTRGMIGAKELALLKPTAYLINTSRGPVVDEDALLAALRAKQIAGAGIDVYKQEPIPFPHPLLELPNVVVTPHIASATQNGMWKMGVVVAEEMLAALRGDKPRFIANPQVWGRGTRVKHK
jgi:phosphoglycerate dehydrogenase-like enzyme